MTFNKKVLVTLLGTLAITSAIQAGEITLYTSQPQKQMVKVVELFQQKYPNIKVNVYRDGTTKVLSKLQAEIVADSPKPDVLMIADSVAMDALKRQGVLQPYKDAPVKDFDPSQYDKDKYYFGTKLITTGIIYNTKAGVPVPESWNDLLSMAVKNQVIMPSPLYSGAAVIHVGTLTEQPDFGWAYYEKLAKNGAVAGKGNGSVRNAVARGQKAYGIIIDYMAIEAKKKGSPVDFVFPKEGVTSINQPVAILKSAKNVEDARKFIDFQLSKDAQLQSVSQNYIPLMKSIKVPEAYGNLSKLKVMKADPKVIQEKIEENKKKFANLFGGA